MEALNPFTNIKTLVRYLRKDAGVDKQDMIMALKGLVDGVFTYWQWVTPAPNLHASLEALPDVHDHNAVADFLEAHGRLLHNGPTGGPADGPPDSDGAGNFPWAQVGLLLLTLAEKMFEGFLSDPRKSVGGGVPPAPAPATSDG